MIIEIALGIVLGVILLAALAYLLPALFTIGVIVLIISSVVAGIILLFKRPEYLLIIPITAASIAFFHFYEKKASFKVFVWVALSLFLTFISIFTLFAIARANNTGLSDDLLGTLLVIAFLLTIIFLCWLKVKKVIHEFKLSRKTESVD